LTTEVGTTTTEVSYPAEVIVTRNPYYAVDTSIYLSPSP